MRFVRNVCVGAVAGAAGTAAMDLVLYRRYQRDDGKENFWRWEFAGDVMSWDQASAPGQLARKTLRIMQGHEPPGEWARRATNIVHWLTGAGWGMAYGALASATSRYPRTRQFALGPVVWLSGYVVLPLARVYEPIWKYNVQTLGDDFSAHSVYGAVTTAVFSGLGSAMTTAEAHPCRSARRQTHEPGRHAESRRRHP